MRKAVTARTPAARLQLVLPLLLWVLASCTSLPARPPIQPEDVVEVPAAWSTAGLPQGTAPPLGAWWLRFDDPLLSDLIAQATRANTSVAAARANILQSRALRDLAAAALWPSLSASASLQQGSAGGHSTGRQIDLGLNANVVPDVFGANQHALAAASAQVQASLADAGVSEVTVASEVGLNYILLREGQARAAIARDNLASQLDTLQITTWREQAGLATAIETAQANTAVEQTRALLPPLNASIDLARHALAVLTGRPPAALQTVLDGVRAIPQADPALTLSIPADTLRQRADVRAADRRVSAALSRVSQAEAARYPGFAIAGSLGLGATGVGALFESGAVLTSILASATAPLFDAGAIRAEVRVQEAGLEQARVTYRATVLGALKEVEDALLALSADRNRVAALQSAAVSAAQAAQMSRQRFTGGLVDFQVVLETQRTQLVTQDSLAIGTADIGSDLVRLYVALGGGWREDAESERAPVSVRTGWVWSP